MMTTTDLTPRPPAAHPPRNAPARPLLLGAAASSLGLTLLAGWLVSHPADNPLQDPEAALARIVLSPAAATWALVAFGAVGLVTAVLGLLLPASGGRRALLTAVGAGQVMALGIGWQSVSTLALAGYLLAMALPVGLVWLTIQVIRRYRLLRAPVLIAVTALVVAGIGTGITTPQHIAQLATEIARGFAANAEALVLVLALAAGTATWLLVLVRVLGPTRSGTAAGAWVVRHRRALTLIAAAGPLPYGLVRATWLTPWPLMGPGGEALPAETRIWGLLLGGGALLGAVLTIGLIRPWGVRFPRWMPRLAGRPVPVAAAAVPGGVVAGLVCASALPMLRLTLTGPDGTVFGNLSATQALMATLIFPLWIWGPALALAVWGYVGHRREMAQNTTDPSTIDSRTIDAGGIE